MFYGASLGVTQWDAANCRSQGRAPTPPAMLGVSLSRLLLDVLKTALMLTVTLQSAESGIQLT